MGYATTHLKKYTPYPRCLPSVPPDARQNRGLTAVAALLAYSRHYAYKLPVAGLYTVCILHAKHSAKALAGPIFPGVIYGVANGALNSVRRHFEDFCNMRIQRFGDTVTKIFIIKKR
jgi:hypothetical protein